MTLPLSEANHGSRGKSEHTPRGGGLLGRNPGHSTLVLGVAALGPFPLPPRVALGYPGGDVNARLKS